MLNSFVHDGFKVTSAETSRLDQYNIQYTITSRENTDVLSSHSTKDIRQSRCLLAREQKL